MPQAFSAEIHKGIYWLQRASIVDSQCCVSFRLAKWFSYTYTVAIFFFQIIFPHRLLQNIGYSFLCYAVGPVVYLFYI